jgi:hypothetical protein
MSIAQPIYSMCVAAGVDLSTLRAVVADWLPHTRLSAPPLCLCMQEDTWELCLPRSVGLRAVNDLEARLRARVTGAVMTVTALTMDPMKTTETVDLRLSPP